MVQRMRALEAAKLVYEREKDMRETGIIMSGDHPKLILEGRKTQTRRVILPNYEAKGCKNSNIVRYCNTVYKGYYMFEVWSPLNTKVPLPLMIKCPYGQVGDRLWVKETWAVEKHLNYLSPSELGAAGALWYKADADQRSLLERGKWRPAIFMPRWASRILLEITEVRAERLQEMTEEDANAEGNPYPDMGGKGSLWWYNSLNAKRGYSWDSNPRVWVIKFITSS